MSTSSRGWRWTPGCADACGYGVGIRFIGSARRYWFLLTFSLSLLSLLGVTHICRYIIATRRSEVLPFSAGTGPCGGRQTEIPPSR